MYIKDKKTQTRKRLSLELLEEIPRLARDPVLPVRVQVLRNMLPAMRNPPHRLHRTRVYRLDVLPRRGRRLRRVAGLALVDAQVPVPQLPASGDREHVVRDAVDAKIRDRGLAAGAAAELGAAYHGDGAEDVWA